MDKSVSLITIAALEDKPIYIMAKCREIITREGKISLIVRVPLGCLHEDGVSAKLVNDSTMELNLTWPSVLLDHNKLTSATV